MNLLLDAHAFLWWMINDLRLSRRAYRVVSDPANRVFLSAAAAWEFATKHRLGKLPEAVNVLPRFRISLAEVRIDSLPISLDHALAAGAYTIPHRDPFDRLIAAQGEIEGMAIVTNDRAFRQFPVETIW